MHWYENFLNKYFGTPIRIKAKYNITAAIHVTLFLYRQVLQIGDSAFCNQSLSNQLPIIKGKVMPSIAYSRIFLNTQLEYHPTILHLHFTL